jgi:heterotetrameric sarcosine oxidase gamma subunit
VRAGAGLVDLSAFGKISFRGPGVASLTQALVSDAPVPGPHGVVAFDAGGRALACRLTEDQLWFLALTTNTAPLRNRLAALEQDRQTVECDVSSAYAVFSLLGASTEKVLRHLTALDLGRSAFPAGFCAETSLAGVHALLVRPPGITLDMVLIAVAWDLGEYVWEQLLAGRGHGIEPIGWDSWHALIAADLNTSLG